MDIRYLQTALDLAHHAIGLCSPNPRVGCVLVKDDQIIGQGHTQSVGQAHAEVVAIRDAQQRGHDTAGATAYVTLEPCSHYGRTPPCAHALIVARMTASVATLSGSIEILVGTKAGKSVTSNRPLSLVTPTGRLSRSTPT